MLELFRKFRFKLLEEKIRKFVPGAADETCSKASSFILDAYNDFDNFADSFFYIRWRALQRFKNGPSGATV